MATRVGIVRKGDCVLLNRPSPAAVESRIVVVSAAVQDGERFSVLAVDCQSLGGGWYQRTNTQVRVSIDSVSGVSPYLLGGERLLCAYA